MMRSKAIWGSLPGAIGDFAFQAANGLIGGVEAMLNGVVTRINNFINGLNAALDLLPDWAVGEGGVRIGTLDPVELGRIDNPVRRVQQQPPAPPPPMPSRPRCRRPISTTPDLGLGAMADDATARADGYREAAGMLADAAARPLAKLAGAEGRGGRRRNRRRSGAGRMPPDAADRLDESMTEAGRAAGGAGAAAASRGRSGQDRMGRRP